MRCSHYRIEFVISEVCALRFHTWPKHWDLYTLMHDLWVAAFCVSLPKLNNNKQRHLLFMLCSILHRLSVVIWLFVWFRSSLVWLVKTNNNQMLWTGFKSPDQLNIFVEELAGHLTLIWSWSDDVQLYEDVINLHPP